MDLTGAGTPQHWRPCCAGAEYLSTYVSLTSQIEMVSRMASALQVHWGCQMCARARKPHARDSAG